MPLNPNHQSIQLFQTCVTLNDLSPSCVIVFVAGNLALSRALGDFVFKKNNEKQPEEQIVTGSQRHCLLMCFTNCDIHSWLMWRLIELDVKYSYFWCNTLAKCVTKLMLKTRLCICANFSSGPEGCAGLCWFFKTNSRSKTLQSWNRLEWCCCVSQHTENDLSAKTSLIMKWKMY